MDDRKNILKSHGRELVLVFPTWIGRVVSDFGSTTSMDERTGNI
jgi:hypothetical protein